MLIGFLMLSCRFGRGWGSRWSDLRGYSGLVVVRSSKRRNSPDTVLFQLVKLERYELAPRSELKNV